MKLSKKIKIITLILIILIVLFVFNNVISLEKVVKKNSINYDYNQTRDTYESMFQNIKKRNVYKSQILNFTNEINNLKILSSLEQEKIIWILNNCFLDNNIQLKNINFTEPNLLSNDNSMIESLVKEIIIVDENRDTIDIELKALTLSVNLEFESNFDNMLNFIDAVQNNSVDISVKNISITLSENRVHCSMILNFYALPMIDVHI